MALIDLSVGDLLRALRSPDPTPGGGSASALAGATGAALLTMVAGLTKPRAATAADVASLADAGARCAATSDRLAGLIDRDRDAYDLVVAAFRMPKLTAADTSARGSAIQAAMLAATEAPLDVMRACGNAIAQSAVVAAFGNRNASSDVGVALELLGAGLRGARLNVDINLPSIKDAAFVERATEEARRLAADAELGIATARRALSA